MRFIRCSSILFMGVFFLTTPLLLMGFYFTWKNILNSNHLYKVPGADFKPELDPDIDSEVPLITLFTCFKEKEHKYVNFNRVPLHRLVVKNWASLQPYVQAVLFTTEGSGPLVDMARNHSWKVLPVPGVNKFGTPFIKGMYLTAYAMFKSDFYAFANGDLLFSNQLIATLKAVKRVLCLRDVNMTCTNISQSPFVVGQRRNFIININKDKDIWKESIVQSLPTEIDAPIALDYFITCRHGYPWSLVPDLLIGRVAYDWYLLIQARYHNLTTIDVTNTNRVVHLQGVNLRFTHHSDKYPDAFYNEQILQQFHPYGIPNLEGSTTATQYYTSASYSAEAHTASIMILRRPKYVWSPFKPYFKNYTKIKSFSDEYVLKPNITLH